MTTDERSYIQRIRASLRPPRSLSFTRPGKYFVMMTLGVGFGAINTGNNLLFLLLGMMLSLITASGILSEAVLRGLKVRRHLPSRAFANTPAPGAFDLENPNAYPSLSVEVVEMNATCRLGPRSGDEIGPTRHPWWRFWKSGSPDEDSPPPVGRAYCLRLESGESTQLDATYRFPARGVYELPGLSLTTRFPFSFFEKARDTFDDAEITVYPSPADPSDWMTEIQGAFGDVPADESGRGDEYYGLREYRPGEDKRKIHWKRSASRGELVIKENEAETNRSVLIHLCNATGRPASQRHLVQAQFEEAIRRVAGLIERFSSSGWQLGLRTFDETIRPGQGNVDAMMHALATTTLYDEIPGQGLAAEADETHAMALVSLPRPAQRLPGPWDLLLEIDEEAT